MASSVVGLNGGHVDDYNSQRLDLLDQRIRQKLGLKLTERELKAVRKKYDSRSITDTVDESVERLKRDLQAAMPASFVEQSDAYHSLSIDKVYTLLKDKIRERARSLGSSDSQLQEAVYLLSESRSPFLTRSQLKFGVSIRLNIHLSDKQIEEIFEAFDPMHTGVIKLMEFVKALLKTSSDELNASVLLKPSHQNLGNTSRGVEPTITYDHKVLNLESIYVAPQLRLTLVQIENAIRYKISERSFRGRNLQTLHKVFGDTRSGDAKGNLFISRDQIKYTLFKRFQLNLSDEEIELIFHKYDPEGRGKIPIRRFVKGIIEDEENANEPLIEEKYRGQVRNKSQVLINFLDFLRKKLHELINREGRAPHYWIHVTGRMSAAQAKAFLLEKFKVTVDEVVMKEIADHYESNRLIDVRLLILDVMTVEAKNIMGPEKSLVDGCVVVVDELPASLKDSRFHPDQIEDLLRNKLSERMKNEHPMSTMHKMFRGTGVADTRLISEQGMLLLLNRFDLYMAKEDFRIFFSKHDRGDGKIDTRKFLRYLLPANNYRENPYVPKSEAEHKAELSVAKKMGMIIGGGDRVIDELNGPSYSRLDDKLVNTVLNQEEAYIPETTHEDIGMKSKIKALNAYNKALYTYKDPVLDSNVEHYSTFSSHLSERGPSTIHPDKNSPQEHIHFELSAPSNNLESLVTDFESTRVSAASPRMKSLQKRSVHSPQQKLVNTGQPRIQPVDPHSEFLKQKYSVSQRVTTTSNQLYGAFFKPYLKLKTNTIRIEERLRQPGPPRGAPSSSQQHSPRVSNIKERGSVTITQQLANSFH